MSTTSGRRVARAARLFAVASAILLFSCSTPAVDRTRLEAGIRDLLELRTVEQIYRAVGYISQEKSVLIFKTVDRQLLYAINIRVQAGIDLTRGLQVVPDRFGRGSVTVTLPPATVLSVDADESSIRQYFSREQGGAVSLLDYGDQIAELKNQTEQDAVNRGILARAEANARKLVEYYLRSVGLREIHFAVQAGGAE